MCIRPEEQQTQRPGKGEGWCGWGAMNHGMGTMEQCAQLAVCARSRGSCPEQRRRGCGTEAKMWKKSFPIRQEAQRGV